MTGLGDERTAELSANLDRVRSRISAACAAAGRDPAELTLIAVTKTYPAGDVLRLASLGVTEIGENRDQEAAAKAAEVAAAGVSVRWHFVGTLQRNKCRSVVRYAGLVHTVDSVKLAGALGRAAAELRDRPPARGGEAGRADERPEPGGEWPLPVLVQVSLDGAAGRGGVLADEVPAVAAAVAAQPALAVRGVMAVAPLGQEPRAAFARLAEVAAGLRREHPDATVVSAGMSGDLDAAVACGATHLRIGAAILGNRATLR